MGLASLLFAVITALAVLYDLQKLGSITPLHGVWTAILFILAVLWFVVGVLERVSRNAHGNSHEQDESAHEGRICPQCEEEILGRWRMCPYCGLWFEDREGLLLEETEQPEHL